MNDLAVKTILLSVCLLAILSCSERTRVNPFDPAGNAGSPLELSIRPAGNNSELSWTLRQQISLSGFNLYRSEDDSVNFTLLVTIPAHQRSWLDTTTVNFKKYRYYIAGLGNGTMSSKSNIAQIVLAPTTTYILSKLGYGVHLYSYDLQYALNDYPLSYAPVDWAFPPLAQQIWIAYAQIGALAVLDLVGGQRVIVQSDSIENPVDLEYNELQDEIIFLDDQTNQLGFYAPENQRRHIQLPEDTYKRLVFLNPGKLAVLGSNHFFIYELSGTLIKSFPIENGSDLALIAGKLYVLLFSKNSLKSELFIFSTEGELQTTHEFAFGYRQIFAGRESGFYWMIEQSTENSGKAVKLSNGGHRQLEISLEGEITGMAQNPINKSLVFVERYQDMVVLTDSLGNIISRNDQIYDPIKVRIQ